MPRVVVEGIDGDGLLVVLFGQSIAVLVDAAEGSQNIMVEGIGIAFYSVVAIDFRSLIVLEVIFCQSSVEIGLSQPGLGIDDHIEALDGKHIVLIVQSIASHQEDAVCVDLGQERETRQH